MKENDYIVDQHPEYRYVKKTSSLKHKLHSEVMSVRLCFVIADSVFVAVPPLKKKIAPFHYSVYVL